MRKFTLCHFYASNNADHTAHSDCLIRNFLFTASEDTINQTLNTCACTYGSKAQQARSKIAKRSHKDRFSP